MSSLDALLSLNARHEVETSPLDRAALAKMIEGAFYSTSYGDGHDGFLIAFDQNSDYTSINFLWFKARYDRFVYVDRVIVAEAMRGHGLARLFYQNLFVRARAAGHARILCEINIDPPNPGSLAFHAALGFAEIEQVEIANGKIVSYQMCLL
jgi:uncharacterized protein